MSLSSRFIAFTSFRWQKFWQVFKSGVATKKWEGEIPAEPKTAAIGDWRLATCGVRSC